MTIDFKGANKKSSVKFNEVSGNSFVRRVLLCKAGFETGVPNLHLSIYTLLQYCFLSSLRRCISFSLEWIVTRHRAV